MDLMDDLEGLVFSNEKIPKKIVDYKYKEA